jgi:hypothetical protein
MAAGMTDPKPLASLGPTLLARKGGARPAMRPQFSAQFDLGQSAEAQEDLGWNDMGEDHTADVLPLTPSPPSPPESIAANDGAAEIHRQQEAIVSRINPVVPAQREPRRDPLSSRKSALDDGRRAAFTLRLDAERHLKLRLACTIRNRSAQQLVTDALDRLLGEMPDLEALAAQVKRD